MGGMTRRFVLFVAAIAVLLAASPLLHQHPLGASSDSGLASTSAPCVACAAGVNRVPVAPPVLLAPQIVVIYALAAPVPFMPVSGVDLRLPSRAPPAA